MHSGMLSSSNRSKQLWHSSAWPHAVSTTARGASRHTMQGRASETFAAAPGSAAAAAPNGAAESTSSSAAPPRRAAASGGASSSPVGASGAGAAGAVRPVRRGICFECVHTACQHAAGPLLSLAHTQRQGRRWGAEQHARGSEWEARQPRPCRFSRGRCCAIVGVRTSVLLTAPLTRHEQGTGRRTGGKPGRA